MTASDFWRTLEYRVCLEFRGMSERRLQYYYCDGFTSQLFHVDCEPQKINGKIWIGHGSDQSLWDLELILPMRFSSEDEIKWELVLPPRDTTKWMGIDERLLRIVLEPAVAVPDFAPIKFR